MNKNIAVLSGDGIGPEVVAEARKVLDAIEKKYNYSFTYKESLVGAIAIDQTGNPLPDETIETCKWSDAILFGAIGHPKYDNDPKAKVRPEQGLLKLRKSLGLYANIRPLTIFNRLRHLSPIKEDRIEGVDFVIYRELTGGIYFGEKGRKDNETTAYDHCEYTTPEIERIAHLAFKAAQLRNKKMTLVDKANVLESSRLWREVVQKLSPEYPDVEVDYLFVDNAAMQIIVNPKQFDVILTENMFGDIISDEASVISGSLGLLPSASVGAETSMYEPIHGSYPQATGKGIANPVATILSAAMILDDFGAHEAAQEVRDAVEQTLEEGIVTTDLNPNSVYKTEDVGRHIAQIIAG